MTLGPGGSILTDGADALSSLSTLDGVLDLGDDETLLQPLQVIMNCIGGSCSGSDLTIEQSGDLTTPGRVPSAATGSIVDGQYDRVVVDGSLNLGADGLTSAAGTLITGGGTINGTVSGVGTIEPDGTLSVTDWDGSGTLDEADGGTLSLGDPVDLSADAIDISVRTPNPADVSWAMSRRGAAPAGRTVRTAPEVPHGRPAPRPSRPRS